MMTADQQHQYNINAKELNILPIKVTPHYEKLVQEEYKALGHADGPLHRVVYPTPERLKTRIFEEVPDFVEDYSNMPVGLSNILIHKYARRALFLVTDKCVGHCMYCCRQAVLSDIHGNPLPALEERLNRVINYLAEHPEINELILSGGDPLNIAFQNLSYLFERLAQETQVSDIRIHSRNLIFAPHVVSQKVTDLLGKYRVRIYLHIVHPYEITENVIDAVTRLQKAGVRTYSHFPILRGVNDHIQVLEKLLRQLDDLRANCINLYVPEPINYSASFRVSMKRLFTLMDELFWQTGSWLNGARLVLDSPIGKVRREDIVAWNQQTGEITFQRAGKNVVYYDFPAELDKAGELDILLWKG